MANKEVGVVRTVMASAMIAGFESCVAHGGNPGKVGRRILTNRAAGVGTKFVPRPKKKETLSLNKNKSTAVSAGEKEVMV